MTQPIHPSRVLGLVANDALTGSMHDRRVEALARARPQTGRVATADLTPDGFRSVKVGLAVHHPFRCCSGQGIFVS
jgi:hypothetical protein